MYRKALVNGEFLYFVHAPPQTEFDTNPEAKRPQPPDPKAPKLYASVYYYWWAFLRLNGDYIECCERGGKGKMAKLYESFGDIRDGRRKSTDPNAKPGEVDEFREWWIERGAKLFAEPETKELIRVLSSFPKVHDNASRALLSIPLAGNVDVTLHAIGAILRPMFRQFQRENGHYSRAMFKPEDNYRLSVLYETLKIANAEIANRKKVRPDKQYVLVDDANIPVQLKDENDDITVIKGKIVSTALKRANCLIANVGEGRFPDFSTPTADAFVFFKPRARKRK